MASPADDALALLSPSTAERLARPPTDGERPLSEVLNDGAVSVDGGLEVALDVADEFLAFLLDDRLLIPSVDPRGILVTPEGAVRFADLTGAEPVRAGPLTAVASALAAAAAEDAEWFASAASAVLDASERGSRRRAVERLDASLAAASASPTAWFAAAAEAGGDKASQGGRVFRALAGVAELFHGAKAEQAFRRTLQRRLEGVWRRELLAAVQPETLLPTALAAARLGRELPDQLGEALDQLTRGKLPFSVDWRMDEDAARNEKRRTELLALALVSVGLAVLTAAALVARSGSIAVLGAGLALVYCGMAWRWWSGR